MAPQSRCMLSRVVKQVKHLPRQLCTFRQSPLFIISQRPYAPGIKAMAEPHFSIEPHCVLCRDTILHPWAGMIAGRRRKSDIEKWRLNALGFVRLRGPDNSSSGDGDDGDEVRLRAFRVDADNERWPSMEDISLCEDIRGCPECKRDPDYSVSLVHVDCYQLASQVFGPRAIKMLHLIARRTQPLVARELALLNDQGRQLRLLHDTPNVATNEDTDLGRLLSLTRQKLPTELQDMVLEEQPKLLECLRNASKAIDWASSPTTAIRQPPDMRPPAKPFAGCSVVKQINAGLTRILDETCIAWIGPDSSSASQDTEVRSIQVREHKIFGIEVSFGVYGVAALRVMYLDGSTSAWLGTPDRWFATVPCNDWDHIQVVSDVS